MQKKKPIRPGDILNYRGTMGVCPSKDDMKTGMDTEITEDTVFFRPWVLMRSLDNTKRVGCLVVKDVMQSQPQEKWRELTDFIPVLGKHVGNVDKYHDKQTFSDVVKESETHYQKMLDSKLECMNYPLSCSKVAKESHSNVAPHHRATKNLVEWKNARKKKLINLASYPLVGKISIMKHVIQEGNTANTLSHITECLGGDELMNVRLTNRTCWKSFMNNYFWSHVCIMCLIKIINIHNANSQLAHPFPHTRFHVNYNLLERIKYAMTFCLRMVINLISTPIRS